MLPSFTTWISDLGGVGQLLVEHRSVGTGEVERRPSDVVPPLLPFRRQPLLGLVTTATWDDVEQLACVHVDDLGGELLAVPWTDSGEEHLVETEGLHRSEPVFVFHQGGAVGDDGVVDGVPVTTELDSDLVHGPGVTADLFGDPPSGPIRQHQSLGCDARLVLGPAAARTGRLRAVPPELVPREAGGTAERGKIDKGDHRTVLHPGDHAALRASRTSSTSFDMDGQRDAHLVVEAEHGHLR